MDMILYKSEKKQCCEVTRRLRWEQCIYVCVCVLKPDLNEQELLWRLEDETNTVVKSQAFPLYLLFISCSSCLDSSTRNNIH